MGILDKIKDFFMHGPSPSKKEREIHERIMKKRSKAYEELARY